jgi:hypothetical protein
MKIAILANDSASYVKPMAEGLARMLSRVGVNSTVFYDGLAELGRVQDTFSSYVEKNNATSWRVVKRTLRFMIEETPHLYRFMLRLRSFDAVVIVQTIPANFMKTFFNDRMVRWLLPDTPLVLYDLFYLPTRGFWPTWLKEGRPEMGIPTGGHWGLERYDWYLSASVVSETPMPPGVQPYSLIGLDLNDGSVAPGDKSEFVALLDFEDPQNMRERAVQIQACEESQTKYVVLHGRYSIEAIRRIHGTSSIFFVSMRESFGLPICEAQRSGSYVFTPYGDWCPSHWLKPDLSKEGPGELSPNFIVYHNDKGKLIREIERVKRTRNPAIVVHNFLKYHPQLFFGNDAEVSAFVGRLRDGSITSRTHEQHGDIRGCGYFPSHRPMAALSTRAIVNRPRSRAEKPSHTEPTRVHQPVGVAHREA